VDPATMAMLASFGSSLGGGQLGDIAPPFQPGPSPGLLGGPPPQANPAIGMPDIAGLAQSASQSDPALAMPMEGPPQPYGQPGGPSGPPQDETPQSGFGDKLGGFFGNIDNTLQSPSKTIGLGLLGNIDPRLGYAGLLASGFFGGKKGGT